MQSKYKVLKQYFGYDEFRDGQEFLIDSILQGEDVVGIMPTGAGKSFCYQIPALVMEGITLVISPLISLMKDQVNALTQAGVRAAYINSSLTERQTKLAIENAKKGIYKIIYVAPERLEVGSFIDFAVNGNISMVTVDEAHCISQWGQDFRPSYVKIESFIKLLKKRPIVSAFTATATPKVKEDIIELLDLKSPKVLVTGFDRKNLYFEVQKPKDKFSALMQYLSVVGDKSGIVYCSTRNTVEEVCDSLRQKGYNALRYHAGLPDRERQVNQDAFLYDKVQIMVATNAFGMGIDKSNVSFVVHYNMPKNIESYYQEAGRAGRDGENADCILLYSARDVRTNTFLIENNKDIEYPDAETEKMLKELDRQRLKEMTFYCHSNDCLRSYILKYFGEHPENYCGNCSSCNTNYEHLDITLEAQKILSCIVRVKGNYGIKIIIDILRGSKSERIKSLGFDKLSTYGISTFSESRLRDIINHLVLNNYLCSTNDEFPVLKPGERANEILRDKASIHMKLPKETLEKPSKSTVLKPVDKTLLEKLKALRMEIAREQRVPPFVIFTESTLTDMCMKMPTSEEAMLGVSGVGQVKLDKYGLRFLKTIKNYAENAPEESEKPTPEKGTPEQDIILDPQNIEKTDEPVPVSQIADRINCELIQKGYKKITAAKLNDWLLRMELLKIQNSGGQSFKVATEKGHEIGILTHDRIIRNAPVKVNVYNQEAQKYIIDRVDMIIESIQ